MYGNAYSDDDVCLRDKSRCLVDFKNYYGFRKGTNGEGKKVFYSTSTIGSFIINVRNAFDFFFFFIKINLSYPGGRTGLYWM